MEAGDLPPVNIALDQFFKQVELASARWDNNARRAILGYGSIYELGAVKCRHPRSNLLARPNDRLWWFSKMHLSKNYLDGYLLKS